MVGVGALSAWVRWVAATKTRRSILLGKRSRCVCKGGGGPKGFIHRREDGLGQASGHDLETYKILVSPLCLLWMFISELNRIPSSVLPLGYLLYLSLTMPVVDLDSVQFYQPPIEASLPCKRVPRVSNAKGPSVVERGKFPKAPGPSDKWSILYGDKAIEFIDMTDPPRREYLSLLRELSSDLKATEVYAGGEVFCISSKTLSNHFRYLSRTL